MPRPNDVSVGSAVKSIRLKILDIPLPESVQTGFDTISRRRIFARNVEFCFIVSITERNHTCFGGLRLNGDFMLNVVSKTTALLFHGYLFNYVSLPFTT